MNFVYYLLLQDRITETIELFGKIGMFVVRNDADPREFEKDGTLQMQYDYMLSYLDFFTGAESNYATARKVAKRCVEYPVLPWRVLFLDIIEQLREFDGEEVGAEGAIDQEDEEKRKENLKKSLKQEPMLAFSLQGTDLLVEHMNVKKATLKYYLIDPEILFSRAPFLLQNTEDFSYVQAALAHDVQLDPNVRSTVVPIPQQLQTKNLVIEVSHRS